MKPDSEVTTIDISDVKQAATHIAFSPIDAYPIIDDKYIASMQSLRYWKDKDGVTGVMSLVFFADDQNIPLFKELLETGREEDMIIKFANEYGGKHTVTFKGFQIIRQFGRFDLDDVIIQIRYLFKASELEGM